MSECKINPFGPIHQFRSGTLERCLWCNAPREEPVTEKVVEFMQKGPTPDTVAITMGAWDLEHALSEYLLQNGQITNADQVVGLHLKPPAEDDDGDYPEVEIIIKTEAKNGVSE